MTAPLADLRSDTVTRPTAAMRTAIATADVGDDVYSEDPTVDALEARVAELFGHEAALFAPSGTMANQIAIQTLVAPGQALLCDEQAHVLLYEGGGLAVTGGITTRTFAGDGGVADPEHVARMLGSFPYALPVAAVAVEHTHMRAGGVPQPLDHLRRLREVTAAAGVALHCDGARIWHAHIAEGIALQTYGALFDTLAVCLSKGLGAPVGSVVVSSSARIARARELRRVLGGQLRQAGVLAAAGLHALDHHLERLADDHDRARSLAERLAFAGAVDPDAVRTNIINIDLGQSAIDADAFVRAAAERSVLLVRVAPRTVRAVTHLDIDDEALDHAADVLAGLLRDDGR